MNYYHSKVVLLLVYRMLLTVSLLLMTPIGGLAMDVDNTLYGISTLIMVQTPIGSSQASGFFFQELGTKESKKEQQWVKIDNVWLVTNRHVVLPKINGKEIIPESLTFHLRKSENGKVVWAPITLTKQELLSRAKFHPNAEIDVCIIQVYDLLTEKLKSGEQYLQWFGVSKDNFAGQNKIHPHVASDAVVVGYPRGFYDQVNLFPIVKSGIIASRWGSYFDGKPYFLIDAKLFPGSSGSIVISKPNDIVVENGQMFLASEKQFAFLGIYSGEPYQQNEPIEFDDVTFIRKSGFNVGIVWYGQLIEEIIQNGIHLSVP